MEAMSYVTCHTLHRDLLENMPGRVLLAYSGGLGEPLAANPGHL